MNTYYLNFNIERIECDNIKQKQVGILRTIIESGRLSNDMEFNCYGIISFADDDKKHINPIVEENENFNRLKTNCLIYNLKETDANVNDFDKCFIYQTNGAKNVGFFGYVLYNTKTAKIWHKYCINRNEGDLCQALHRTFNILRFRDRYYPYV